MPTKLIELTEEQKAKMETHAEAWVKIGLSTEPADFEAAKPLLDKIYEFTDVPHPDFFFTTSSPFETVMIGAAMLNLSKGELAKLPQHLSSDMPFIAELIEKSRELIREKWSSYLGGNLWCWWPAMESFYREVCDLELPDDLSDRGRVHTELSKLIGWWYPTNWYVVMTDRPEKISIEEGRLHSPEGYAIRWRDGKGIAAWKGTVIPVEWVTGNPPDVVSLLHWEDIEQRRCGFEIIGWAKVIDTLGGVMIDSHPNPEIGDLYEVNIPGVGKEKFLRARCGTGRDVAVCVDPSVTTALEASARSYEFYEVGDEYIPEVRT